MEENTLKLHIIANCTNRKRFSPEVCLGDVFGINLSERAENWWRLLNEDPKNNSSNNLFPINNHIKAADLYIGSYWSSIRQIPGMAKSVGLQPALWIISAGYGLISGSDQIKSYSATFSNDDENSIYESTRNLHSRNEILKEWWQTVAAFQLNGNSRPRLISELIKTNKDDYFLIVASADYLLAIENDLKEGLKYINDSDRLIIISTKNRQLDETLINNHIPSDARLQCDSTCPELCSKHLVPKGVRVTISSKLALKIVEKTKDWGLSAKGIKQKVSEYINQSPALLQHNRLRLDDSNVEEYILTEMSKERSLSCSTLLRKLRDSGQACEQGRFRQIYNKVKGEMNEV